MACYFIYKKGIKHMKVYNRNGVKEYASNYWNNYNKKYKSYAGVGGDCANFVSQCLYEGGGLPMKFTGKNRYDKWYYTNTGRTSSWTGAQSLRLFFKKNTGTPKIGYSRQFSIEGLKTGDLAFRRSPFKGNINDLRSGHVAIVDCVKDGKLYVYSHTKDLGGYKYNGEWKLEKYDEFLRLDDSIETESNYIIQEKGQKALPKVADDIAIEEPAIELSIEERLNDIEKKLSIIEEKLKNDNN